MNFKAVLLESCQGFKYKYPGVKKMQGSLIGTIIKNATVHKMFLLHQGLQSFVKHH